ncbi:FHA domain-containing protein [Nocardioides sp. JQ2195]|uniref:RDD family protein n=1 Tax=Nocardioides sp. JQ2195 TaxID=2592334 RepID=UPI00143E4207|nr:RDD family protein [Nocardioides sp. JQ2195]QIX25733.1 FHA domain-containing protein [Nocardioides sp. JQ2195]
MAITSETALVAEPERRFRAFAVDRAIAWTLFAAAAVAGWWWFFREDEVWPGIAIIVATVVVVSLAFVVVLGIKGTSPGRSMIGLRVVGVDGGEPIGIPRALVRSLILGVGSLPMFGLGLATLAWTAVEDRTRERRGWHDHVARSVVLDVRPRPVAEVEADERPRHVVNLTAMKLMPVRQQSAPVVPAPEPAPTPSPSGQPDGRPVGESMKPPSGFETPEARRRRIDAPWHTDASATGSAPGPQPSTAPSADRPAGPAQPGQPGQSGQSGQSVPWKSQQPSSQQSGPQQPSSQQSGPQQPGPQQPGPQQPGPQQPGPQQPAASGSLQGQQGSPSSPGQPPPHPGAQQASPPPPRHDGSGVIGAVPGRHAGPPPRSSGSSTRATTGQPTGQPAGQPAGQRRAQPSRPPITWRVTFDTGESFVVEGLGLVGRQPSGRPGEPVRHVVPLRSDDMSISKTHAQFHIASDGALVVIDRGSTNGSLLLRKGVSRELSAGRPTTLVDGDRVCFGDRQMTVTREGS